MIPPSRQAGAALLSILLIVATLSVAALIVTETIARQTETQKLSARRSAASWAARSAEAAALASASEMTRASRLPAAGDGTDRVRTLVLPIDGGQIVFDLRELPPCLNLNALANPDETIRVRQSSALKALLDEMGIPRSDAESLAATLIDWVDADFQQLPGGAEDDYYTTRQAGFRAANQPLQGLAELAPLPGFTPELRRSIAPYICAVPQTEPLALNMNAMDTESAYVLSAATGGALSLSEARKLIDARPSSGWNSISEINTYAARDPSLELALAGLPMSVQGFYFTGSGRVALDSGSWPFAFIVSTESQGSPRIVWRSFGVAG